MPVCQWQNRVVVSLGQGVSNTEAFDIGVILEDDALVSDWIVRFHPFKQCWANIKTNAFEITKFSIWPVTFCMDADVPIGIWLSPNLVRNKSRERIIPGWLVKMPVDAQSPGPVVDVIVDVVFDGNLCVFVDIKHKAVFANIGVGLIL